jgi:type VI secretion system secreted protein VgrG
MSSLQGSREVEVSTPLGEDVLLFQHMTASEQLSKPFEFELNLLSEQPDIKMQDLLGQPIKVRLTLPNGEIRYFHGLVSRFCQSGMFGDYHAYQASLKPWLWFLSRITDCRIFQNMKVPDIVKQVFRDRGFSDFEESLSEEYREWEYCVQYRETDFNFVSRLVEQEGIYYYFKHEEGKHILVLADNIGAHDLISGYEEVPYYPPQHHERREREHIFDWFIAHEVQPSSFMLNDFNFEKPRANLKVKSKSGIAYAIKDLDVFDYPGEYVEPKEGEAYVRRRMQELETQYEIRQGHSNTRGFTAGGLFKLTNHPRKDQNQEYLIVSALHDLQSGQYQSGEGGGGGEAIFNCNFTAIKSTQQFRPTRSTPKPIVQGPQTAVVVGKSGEEIHTDKYGRVKVQFHWDRYGNKDENSSCWIRVSHPWAGKGWGSVSIPRIGQEVIVDFLEGDPDRPIITGRVYNADLMPPYKLPNDGMVSGFKSNTTPGGGGYNEISANDTKDKEVVTVHAQKDMNTTVENNQSTTVVGGNRTLTVKAGTNTETIKKDASLKVEDGSRTVTVTGGDYFVTASKKVSLTGQGEGAEIIGFKKGVSITGFDKGVDIVGASKGVQITGTGAGVKIVGNDKGVSVTGNAKGVTITGNANGVNITGKGKGVTVNGDPSFTGVGTSKVTIKGPTVNIGDGEVMITGKKITLAVGGNSITIDSAGITASGLSKIN